jgi:dTDP-4-dehydrorhamnose 3,5-epimerase
MRVFTLEPIIEIAYKIPDYLSLDHYGGIRWNNPDLGIERPASKERTMISERDRKLPLLSEFLSTPTFV